MPSLNEVAAEIETKRQQREQVQARRDAETRHILERIIAAELPKLMENGDRVAQAMMSISAVAEAVETLEDANLSLEKAKEMLSLLVDANKMFGPGAAALPAVEACGCEAPPFFHTGGYVKGQGGMAGTITDGSMSAEAIFAPAKPRLMTLAEIFNLPN